MDKYKSKESLLDIMANLYTYKYDDLMKKNIYVAKFQFIWPDSGGLNCVIGQLKMYHKGAVESVPPNITK